jgi:hypothetical protein
VSNSSLSGDDKPDFTTVPGVLQPLQNSFFSIHLQLRIEFLRSHGIMGISARRITLPTRGSPSRLRQPGSASYLHMHETTAKIKSAAQTIKAILKLT